MLQHRQLPWQDKQSQHHRCGYAGFQSGILSIKSHPSLSKASFYKIWIVAGPTRHWVRGGANECSWRRGQTDQNLWETNNMCSTKIQMQVHIQRYQIQVKEIESFVIVYKYKDRFTSPFARTLRVITKMFGENFQHKWWISSPNPEMIGKVDFQIQETFGRMLSFWSTFGVSTLFMWRTDWTRGWVPQYSIVQPDLRHPHCGFHRLC